MIKKLSLLLLGLTLLFAGCSNVGNENEVEISGDYKAKFKLEEIPMNSHKNFQYDEYTTGMIINSDEEYHVYDTICPIHPHLHLDYDGNEIDCPHGSFDVEGKPISGLPVRAGMDLIEIGFEVTEDEIIIK